MINLYELLEASSGQLFGEPSAQLFEDFSFEASIARPNHLYVATSATVTGTQRFIRQAIDNGASGIICEHPPELDTHGISVVLVRNVVSALLSWSQFILGKYGTRVIGVAGAAGKSVAVDAIGMVLAERFPVYVNSSMPPGRIGIPMAIAKLKPYHKFAVLKLSPVNVGDMSAMVQSTQPVAGILTTIGEGRSKNFDTIEQFAEEVSQLVEYLAPSALAVLNYDDDLIRSMLSKIRADVNTLGIASYGADMIAHNLRASFEKTTFDLRFGDQRFNEQYLAILGNYHLYSIMAALCIGLRYDIALETSLSVLSQMQPLPGRLNRMVGKGNSTLIDDTYSANSQSAVSVLKWLEAVKDETNRVFFVFGEMGGVTGANTSGYRAIGTHAATIADVFIAQGINAEIAARSAIDNGMSSDHVFMTSNHSDTVSILEQVYQLDDHDVLLIKGGPSARMETVVRAMLRDKADERALLTRESLNWIQPTQMPSRLTWIELDYEAMAGNVQALKQIIGDDVTLMAIVKSDAYGHGAVLAARTALQNGANYLGVSSINEAIELRGASIEAPILILNYTPPHMVSQAFNLNVTLTVFDLETARAYNMLAREQGHVLRVHLKTDTGMGRLGVLADETVALCRHVLALSNLDLEGIYTHFSMADTPSSNHTQTQLDLFKSILRDVQEKTGHRPKYTHAANSAATVAFPESRLNMVRTGIALYGMHPSDDVLLDDRFSPVLTWKTIVVQVKTLPAGHPVGYGNLYVTTDTERVAVLPVGYADGFRRAPANWGEVLVQGRRAPIIGRISMEKTIISVNHIPDVAVGDEVVLIGQQGDEVLSAEQVARRLGTINYEVTTSALARIPRR